MRVMRGNGVDEIQNSKGKRKNGWEPGDETWCVQREHIADIRYLTSDLRIVLSRSVKSDVVAGKTHSSTGVL